MIYNFAGGTDGRNPDDGLIADTAGNYYGTTASGGGSTNCTNGCGTVFELSPNGSGWTEKVLYRFQGPNDGENPDAGLVMDSAGNLYGNTWQGGPGGGGTVYKLTNSGGNWTETTIYSVPVAGYAVGRVVRDSSGNLYEALQGGGGFGVGQILELMPSGGNWIYIDLYDFTGGATGHCDRRSGAGFQQQHLRYGDVRWNEHLRQRSLQLRHGMEDCAVTNLRYLVGRGAHCAPAFLFGVEIGCRRGRRQDSRQDAGATAMRPSLLNQRRGKKQNAPPGGGAINSCVRLRCATAWCRW